MLLKLSLTGIKSRLSDYLVLFSGLVMASGIFYMFESMATNEAFLKSNTTISSVVFIFHLGSVLLALITLIYILYANSFLMTMRQKDYAMFMMLGAKGRKIGQLIFIETFFVGILATALGAVLGIGLSTVVSHLLTEQLEVTVQHFSAFNTTALLVTFIFFIILFLLAAVINASAIVKKPILTLLKAGETPVRVRRRAWLLAVEAVLGILMLAGGYYLMTQLMKLGPVALVGALITIVLGTYFIFHSVMIFVLRLLKRSSRISLKQLNNFTLSQLSFRLQDYTKMLSMVAMIFALALGALTVGLGFRNEIPKMTNQVTVYDLVLNNAQKVDQAKVSALDPTLAATYDMKEDDTTVYFIKDQFNQQPLLATSYENINNIKKVKYSGNQLASDVTVSDNLRQMELPEQRTKEQKFLTATEFSQVTGTQSQLQTIQVSDFMAQKEAIKKLVNLNEKNNPSLKDDPTSFYQKYQAYTVYNSLFSGFEFMGFFLGIAFLTMLASCLMFKILSGAASDVLRYKMLSKIGTRTKLLKNSLRKEIGILFLVPGVLGVVHVLFGLQMFSTLMSDPYSGIWIPFTIFFVLYLIYYLLTVWLYTGIVLKKK